MALEVQAVEANGRVVVLLGNHEMMNLMGDLRYVSPEVYLNFSNANSEERRRKAYQDVLELLELAPEPEFERQWMQAASAGFSGVPRIPGPRGEVWALAAEQAGSGTDRGYPLFARWNSP